MRLCEFEDQVYKEAMSRDYSPIASDPLFRELYGTRPGVDMVEMINATAARPMMELAAFFESEVSIFADMVQVIVQETLRGGLEWQARFASKCMLCDYESKEDIQECPNCGSHKMRGPNKAELRLLSRLDGTTFIDRANDNGQSLLEILSLAVRNTVIFDRPYLLLLKAYIQKEDGTIENAYLREVLSLDPRFITTLYDKTSGRLGDGSRVCLEHREASQSGERCSACGKPTYEVQYRSVAVNNGRSFVAGEIVTGSLYHPFLVSGFPIALKMADELFAYHFLEKRTRIYYEKGRPPGLLGIRTNNPQGAYELWTKVQELMKKDPMYLPLIASDSGSAGGPLIQFVSLMQDPNKEQLATKEDLRQRIGSMLGVSIIYQNDTSNSGGLKNDQNLFRVTRYTTQRIKRFVDEKLLRPIIRGVGIQDHDLVVHQDDDENKAAEIEIRQKEADYAKTLLDMGIGAEYEDGTWHFVSGPAKKQEAAQLPQLPGAQPWFESGGQKDPALLAQPAKTPEELPDMPDVTKGEMTDEEFCDSLVSKGFFSNALRKSKLLQALAKMQKMGSFANLSPQEAEGAYSRIVDVMSQDKWTMREVAGSLQRLYPSLPDVNADAIARTETMAIAGTARELDFEENNPADARYRWQGPDDDRTTAACREAVKGSAQGMGLQELKEYLHQVAEAHHLRPRDWVLHPNERHRAVRVVNE